ncbi:MAG: tRNA (adenosine(37)-N6)-threonylcarbamoyltransferase complex transferase subunit TsaD, partial [Patescibacteria group bacterium]|nr:tRNA (adenosine(37)-N6)-threonylcarbamoyltransferase complex transferase subunit TsaD [Patescibacteria group bacterium]
MIILAIETSCDETAVAIVEFKRNRVKILSDIISSQIKTHSKYGGVVPALASRMHLKNMVPVLRKAFQKAKIEKNKIDYVAVTKGPGLIPALIVGVGAAKALAYSLDKPLIAVNHLEGHIYANWLEELKVYKVESQNNYKLWKPKFPVLCLIVSGGHTQLILMKKDLNYKIIGETVDDAAGEAFDKVAKLLGLQYPGGPLIEKIAKKGNKNKFNFTRPMMHSKNYNFSFSGLKTAVLYEVRGRDADLSRLNLSRLYDQDAINRRLYDQDAINRRLYDQDAINRRLYDQDAINRRLYDQDAINRRLY